METHYWTIDPDDRALEHHPGIQEAAVFLKENHNVAFPTETVYGLGGNAKSDEAIEKIYQAKGRPGDNPLIVHIASHSQLTPLVQEIPQEVEQLINVFWPGPLTVVLPAKSGISSRVTAGLSTVAVRMPSHPIALALIKAAARPIAAPSANLSGRPSPTEARHVKQDLDGRIAGIIDGGTTGVGVESTVIDCSERPFTLLRPGGVTIEQLQHYIPDLQVDPSLNDDQLRPKSPGMKYKHYAPTAPMYLVDGPPSLLQAYVDHYRNVRHLKVGVLTTEENKAMYSADSVLACGVRSDLATVTHGLYNVLRRFDEELVDVILSETFPSEGIGKALMNRLLKAAGGHFLV